MTNKIKNDSYVLEDSLKKLRIQRTQTWMLDLFKMSLGAILIIFLFVVALFNNSYYLKTPIVFQYLYIILLGIGMCLSVGTFLYFMSKKTVVRLNIQDIQISKLEKITNYVKRQQSDQEMKSFSLERVSLSFLEQIAIFEPNCLQLVEAHNINQYFNSDVELVYYSNIRPK